MTDMELMEEYGVPVPLPEDFDIEESYTLAYNVWLIGFDAYPSIIPPSGSATWTRCSAR